MRSLSRIFFILVIAISSAAAFAQPDDDANKFQFNEEIDLQSILNGLMNAAENGEVVLFDLKLTKDMFVPVKIVHEYDIESDSIRINIVCRLITPMKLPKYEETNYVDGMTVYINPKGEVYKILAHVKFK